MSISGCHGFLPGLASVDEAAEFGGGVAVDTEDCPYDRRQSDTQEIGATDSALGAGGMDECEFAIIDAERDAVSAVFATFRLADDASEVGEFRFYIVEF